MIIDHPKPSQLGAMRALWKEAFGDTDAFLDAFFQTALSADRALVAETGGKVVAALYWFDCTCESHRLAYIYAVATAKAFRGQGICHKLMEQLHHLLAERGYAGTILVPGEKSLFRFYEAMGYHSFCRMRDFICAAGPEPVAIYPVDTENYARLRRQLLPEGGVVQEKENLDFLAMQARLYAGTGFALACRREEDRLLGLELLGDVSAAPGILTALGCGSGVFRIFDEGEPFAMYRPLTDVPAPSYFAFAFD